MFGRTKEYEVCLPHWPGVLAGLGELIGASDPTASFRAARSHFEDSTDPTQEWTVEGSTGCTLAVTFEEHEGYLFGVLRGKGPSFNQAAEFLWDAYIAQGGNPEAQERPR